ncbi:MAG: hypothetical protein ACLQVI_28245 [Polyangiaceae bacterium]
MAEKPIRPRAPSETFLRDAEAARIVRDKLRFVLEYGVLAPGGHPWMIAVGDTAVDLRLGHRCERTAHDRLHRDAIIGCGIGLTQLKLALRQLGCIDSTILLPEESQPDLLARVYIDKVEDEADPQSFVLYQALYTPVSKVPRPIDAAFQEELAAHAQSERAILSFTSADELPPSDVAAPCGAPMLGSVVRRLAWMESRVVQPGDPSDVGGHTDLTFEGSVGAVIATKEDKVADWLSAGQALARVALRARVEGFYTHVERAAHGTRVGSAFGQIALRIGVPRGYGGTAQPPTPAGHFYPGAPGRARSA